MEMKMVISYITTDYFEIKSKILNSVWLSSLLFVILCFGTLPPWACLWLSHLPDGSQVIMCVIIINSLLNILNHMGCVCVCSCVWCVCDCYTICSFFLTVWGLDGGSQSQFGTWWILYCFSSAVPRSLLVMCKLHNPDNEALLEKGEV